jgi:hypothetical protein
MHFDNLLGLNFFKNNCVNNCFLDNMMVLFLHCVVYCVNIYLNYERLKKELFCDRAWKQTPRKFVLQSGVGVSQKKIINIRSLFNCFNITNGVLLDNANQQMFTCAFIF